MKKYVIKNEDKYLSELDGGEFMLLKEIKHAKIFDDMTEVSNVLYCDDYITILQTLDYSERTINCKDCTIYLLDIKEVEIPKNNLIASVEDRLKASEAQNKKLLSEIAILKHELQELPCVVDNEMSTEDLAEIIKTHFVNKDGNIDISDLDFSDFEGDLLLSRIRIKGDIYQDKHDNEGFVYQCHHINTGDIYQSGHTNEGDIIQVDHKNTGSIRQNNHDNEGVVYEDEKTSSNSKVTKAELVTLLKNHFRTEKGDIDISDLYFGDFSDDINLNSIVTKGDICQSDHITEGDIYQNSHKNEGDVYQGYHTNGGYIDQNNHQNKGYVSQSSHKNEGYISQSKHTNIGDIYQRHHTNDGDVFN